MENKITLAAQGNVQNPVMRFFARLNAKRRKVAAALTAMISAAMMCTTSAFAATSSAPVVDGDAAFSNVIGFFATWIGRIGLVVAFVGGIMFALAIKNDDAEAKTRGLMTLASGFVVVRPVCL